MSNATDAGQKLLQMYRERSGDPAFWAEPLNALSNAAFVIAAALALDLAVKRRTLTTSVVSLIAVAAVIGCGSFLFHTIPTPLTKWLDIIPIASFLVLYLWLICDKLLLLDASITTGIVIAVVGTTFALLPVHEPFNGSLFYLPSLLAMYVFGLIWAQRSHSERFLLLGAACCFTVAITARSVDWIVPWPWGTHFLWHLLNGIVVYGALRTWIVANSIEDARHGNPVVSRNK